MIFIQEALTQNKCLQSVSSFCTCRRGPFPWAYCRWSFENTPIRFYWSWSSAKVVTSTGDDQIGPLERWIEPLYVEPALPTNKSQINHRCRYWLSPYKSTYMRLILKILDLGGILESSGFRSEKDDGLETSELCRIDQHRFILAVDLVQRADIGRHLSAGTENYVKHQLKLWKDFAWLQGCAF